jgi:hypothetical protein
MAPAAASGAIATGLQPAAALSDSTPQGVVRTFYCGLELVCRKRLETKFADDNNKFVKRGMLFVNYTYIVAEATPAGLVLDDLEGGRAYVAAKDVHHLSYAHAFTGHSQQGVSADDAVVIFDHWLSFVDSVTHKRCGVTPEWAYTALSRVRDMSKLYVYVGSLKDDVLVKRLRPEHADGVSMPAAQPHENVERQHFEAPEAVLRAFARRIFGHQAADTQAGRTWTEGEYIMPEDVLRLAALQNSRCAECGCALQLTWAKSDPEQASIDRIDNAKAHIRSNCRLVCLRCNKVKH